MAGRRTTLTALAFAGAVALAFVVWQGGRRSAPIGYPPVPVPTDNPMSEAKVALGRRLFYERRLSVNGSIACADCHQQRFAFSDPRPRSVGATGELTTRNAMTLTNVAYNGRYTWANSTLTTLEQQALVPLTNQHPIEMGMGGHEAEILERLRVDPAYREQFAAAFPDDGDAVTLTNVTRAVSSFVRTLLALDTPYDRFLKGDTAALSDSAQRGLTLFRSSRLNCRACHEGFNFRMTPGHRQDEADTSVAFHNTGLYNLGSNGEYPDEDQGLFDVTRKADDRGRFKAPTLRNIAVTAPYMHDGSIATLGEVIDHYAAGGRVMASGPHAGDGRTNPNKSPLVRGFAITAGEKRDLLAFLESLTDRTFLSDVSFAEPPRPRGD